MQQPTEEIGLSRRHFLAGAASTAGLALAAPALVESLSPPSGQTASTVVVMQLDAGLPGCPACCHPELVRQCGRA